MPQRMPFRCHPLFTRPPSPTKTALPSRTAPLDQSHCSIDRTNDFVHEGEDKRTVLQVRNKHRLHILINTNPKYPPQNPPDPEIEIPLFAMTGMRKELKRLQWKLVLIGRTRDDVRLDQWSCRGLSTLDWLGKASRREVGGLRNRATVLKRRLSAISDRTLVCVCVFVCLCGYMCVET